MDATPEQTEHPGQHRRRDAAVLPRLRDERHHRAGAARRARRPEAGPPPRPLRDVRARATTANKPYKKSARIVGDVIGKYHPHGDTAVYDTIVRMAQDFSLRYPLVDGQGNFGSIDGDPPAAMRYTEVRLAQHRRASCSPTSTRRPSTSCPNYDEHARASRWSCRREFPNLLVNGSSGIAVGMATNIPPHNLGEVVDATDRADREPRRHRRRADAASSRARTSRPAASSTAATAIREAYTTGRGHHHGARPGRRSRQTRAADREAIIVTEIPYQVNKARLIEKIAELVQREEDRGHLRPARRVRPRGHARSSSS